jgi:iron complex outermembrane receptor protein
VNALDYSGGSSQYLFFTHSMNMKKVNCFLYLVLLLSLVDTNSVLAEAIREIHGTITDISTHEPLPGVYIFLPDLKTGTISDSEGHYSIRNLPAVPVMIQLSYVGYRTIVENVDLATVQEKNFEMEYTPTEINEVIVTGVGRTTEQKRNPAPVTVVSKSFLLQGAASNLTDALASLPGISQISTGTGISKPVIRGLGYNRVVVIHEGVRQENQQWGDEHGLEVDEYGVDRVEILKGPASLSYGSDALAGVINLIPAPFQPEGVTRGGINANYQTNNGLVGITANMAGHNKGFVWDLRISRKQAHAYQNKYDGYVYNSAFHENDFSLMAGVVRKWGFLNLESSVTNLNPGIVEGERDSVTGAFVYPVIYPDGTETTQVADNSRLRSYSLQVPYQGITHLKSVLAGNFYFGKTNLKTTIGFQQNHRKEFGEPADKSEYGLYFLLNTVSYDFRVNFREMSGFSVSAGMNGMWQTSRNKGSEFLVPAYDLMDAGVYVLARRNLNKFDITGGIRADARSIKGEKLVTGSATRFPGFSSVFSGISGSLGTTWQPNRFLYTKVNASQGFRMPNIAELGSNGIHEGTGRFEIGNPDLRPEKSVQVDLTQGLNTEHVSAEMNFYASRISNYIFEQKIQTESGSDSLTDGTETFRFISGTAGLTGGEIRIDVHPHPFDFIHFENSVSFVRGILSDQPDSAASLPLIPPARISTALRIDMNDNRFLQNTYFRFEIEINLAQHHFYRMYNTETGTPGYGLVNAGMGGDIVRRGKTLFSIYLNASNLTNTTYQSHLSRLKYAGRNEVTGRTGIYNMGRNFSIRLVIPLILNE